MPKGGGRRGGFGGGRMAAMGMARMMAVRMAMRQETPEKTAIAFGWWLSCLWRLQVKQT
jgi:hypothetical protein